MWHQRRCLQGMMWIELTWGPGGIIGNSRVKKDEKGIQSEMMLHVISCTVII